jgi:tetratricopeptide (TPR) repeat protein
VDRDSSLFYLCLADNEFLLGNINESLVFLNRAYSNNSKNTDILRDLFICYTLIDEPEKSLKYCKKYLERIEESKHNFISYNRIGYAYWNNGYKKEGYIYFRKQIKNSEELIKKGQSYATSYRLAPYYDLAGVYAFLGEKDKAYANLRVWARMPVYSLWCVTLIKKDPLFNSIRNESEFQQIVIEVESRYQSEHKRVIKWLNEKGVV